MNPTNLLARSRAPHSNDTVLVTVTGTPSAVTTLARHLAAVTTVLGMRHSPADNTTARDGLRISVQLTVHQPIPGGRQ